MQVIGMAQIHRGLRASHCGALCLSWRIPVLPRPLLQPLPCQPCTHVQVGAADCQAHSVRIAGCRLLERQVACASAPAPACPTCTAACSTQLILDGRTLCRDNAAILFGALNESSWGDHAKVRLAPGWKLQQMLLERVAAPAADGTAAPLHRWW